MVLASLRGKRKIVLAISIVVASLFTLKCFLLNLNDSDPCNPGGPANWSGLSSAPSMILCAFSSSFGSSRRTRRGEAPFTDSSPVRPSDPDAAQRTRTGKAPRLPLRVFVKRSPARTDESNDDLSMVKITDSPMHHGLGPCNPRGFDKLTLSN